MKNKLAGLNLVTTVIFPLSVILMEVFWIYPWLIWLTRLPKQNWSNPPLSLASLALILGISFICTKYLLSRKWPLHWVRLGIIASGIFFIFVIVKSEYGGSIELPSGVWLDYLTSFVLGMFSRAEPLLVAILVSIYLWWRGISLGRSQLNVSDIYRYFLIGVAAVVLVIIMSGISNGADSPLSISSIGIQIGGFFFFGLTAIALANLNAAQIKISADEMSEAPNRRWPSILLILVAVLVIAGIGIISKVSAEFINSFVQVIGSVYDTVFRIFAMIVYYPISWVFMFLYRIVKFIVDLAYSKMPEQEATSDTGELPEIPELPEGPGLPPELMMALKWLFFILLASGIIFLLVKAVFHYMSLKNSDGIEEVHESLWSWDVFKEDLGLFLRKFKRFSGLRRKPKSALSALPEWFLDTFPGMLSVRQIYQCLLWEASRVNLTRLHHETPGEYAGRLRRTIPESPETLDEITDLYIEARYGESGTLEKQAPRANNLWKSLRQLIRQVSDEQST